MPPLLPLAPLSVYLLHPLPPLPSLTSLSPSGAGHAYPRQYVLMNLRFVRKWVVQVAWARDCARLITPISTLGSSGIQLAAYSSGFVQLAFGTHNLYTRRLRTVLRGQNRCSAYFFAAYKGAEWGLIIRICPQEQIHGDLYGCA